MEVHDLGSSVAHEAIHTPTRGQAKAVVGVNGKLVVFLQADNKPWPLLRLDQNCPVCFFDITYHGL